MPLGIANAEQANRAILHLERHQQRAAIAKHLQHRIGIILVALGI